MPQYNKFLNDLRRNGFEVYPLELEKQIKADAEIVEIMIETKSNILLHNASMARYWLFTDLEAAYNYFDKGGKVGFDNANRKLA